jgi:hypothetical protein
MKICRTLISSAVLGTTETSPLTLRGKHRLKVIKNTEKNTWTERSINNNMTATA